MKRILIINGHPDKESFNYALAAAYHQGVSSTDAEVSQINIRELQFNPNLQYGYRKRTELEPDLLDAIDRIKKADHLVCGCFRCGGTGNQRSIKASSIVFPSRHYA